jgi:D-amino peptidase
MHVLISADMEGATGVTWPKDAVAFIGYHRFTARCRPPTRTAALIHDAAARSLTGLHKPPPPVGPFTYEVEFDVTSPVTAVTSVPGVCQTAERRIAFTVPTMAEAIRCFRVVSVLASASTESRYG